MKGRNISHNIRKIIDIVQYVETEGIDAILITLDFEKAFDRVEQEAVVGALKLLNFDEKLIKIIQLLYYKFQSCTINLGHILKWFNPTRGLHQGCPVSSSIFICIVELLGQNIWDREEICGILIDGYHFKSTQFTDDMNLLLKFQATSVQSAITTLKEFERSTGLKLNYDKTNVTRIDSIKNSNVQLKL